MQLVGYLPSSYPARARGIIVKYSYSIEVSFGILNACKKNASAIHILLQNTEKQLSY